MSVALAIESHCLPRCDVQLGLDCHGRVVSADAGWTAITGFTRFEAIGRALHDLIAVSDRAELACVWRALRRHGAREQVLDLQLLTDDGPHRRVRVRLSVSCPGSGRAFSSARLRALS